MRFNKWVSFINHLKLLGLFQTISYLLKRIFLNRGSLISIKISGLASSFFLRNKLFDTHIFYQIFINKDVDFNLPSCPDLIIDCGGNIGLSSLYFKKKYSGVKIISIEPESTNFTLLKKNTIDCDIDLINAAVWHNKTELNLLDEGAGHAGFKTKINNNSKNFVEKINTITLYDLLNDYKSYQNVLVKMDIEGAEFELFMNNPDEWLNKINFLAVEIHEDLNPGVSSLIFKKMNELSFTYYHSGEYVVFIKSIN